MHRCQSANASDPAFGRQYNSPEQQPAAPHRGRSVNPQLDPAARAVIKSRQGVEYLANAEVRVVDDKGDEVAPDGASMGEIIIRGNAVMQGYYRDPEATAASIRDGWFYSGDAAVVHPDGYIEIRDRWKDVIISGGENISSVEVEGTLPRHPAVQEAAVVGLPHEKWGETPCAFIETNALNVTNLDI